MEVKRPKYFTKKQHELLSLTYPGPVGEGITIREACVKLKISESAGYARLKCFKIRFPVAYEQFDLARGIRSKHRIQIKSGAEYGYSIEEPRNWNWENEIKERF